MRFLAAIILLASCLFMNECHGYSADVVVLPGNPIEELRPVLRGDESEEELFAIEERISKVEHLRRTDRKNRVQSVVGCYDPGTNIHRDSGEIYYRKCRCMLCFDGVEYSTNEIDPSCCFADGGNALYANGTTYVEDCQYFTCDDGNPVIGDAVEHCCYGADGQWYQDGDTYVIDCIEYTCILGQCQLTGAHIEDCCSGDYGEMENYETFIHECNLYMCVNGEKKGIELHIDHCCYNRELNESVVNGEEFSEFCIHYKCVNGVARETGLKTTHCCELDGNHYGNQVSVTIGCQSFFCDEGVMMPQGTQPDECCLSSNGTWYANGETFTVDCVDYLCVNGMTMPSTQPGHQAKKCCLDDDGNWHANWARYRYKCKWYECRNGTSVELPNMVVDDCCCTSYGMYFKDGDSFSDKCCDFTCVNGDHQFVGHPSVNCCMDDMMNWHANMETYIFNCVAYKCKAGVIEATDALVFCNGVTEAEITG